MGVGGKVGDAGVGVREGIGVRIAVEEGGGIRVEVGVGIQIGVQPG